LISALLFKQEMKCLEDHYEDIESEDCREEMKKFIEDEDEDLDLDTILMRACTPMIKMFCQVNTARMNDCV